jgi:hypothetical protein
LCRFNTAKRQAEEAGQIHTEDFPMGPFLRLIGKSNKHDYSIKTNTYMDKWEFNKHAAIQQ